jgi:hypothetical protein
LFERGIAPLEIQKNNRELEVIIKEMILNTVRENIPVELILKAYLDETEELDVTVEEKKELIPLKSKTVSTSVAEELEKEVKNNKEDIVDKSPEIDKIAEENINIESGEESGEKENIKIEISDAVEPVDNEISRDKSQDIKFSDIDIAVDSSGLQEEIEAPKTLDRLNQISKEANQKRKEEEEKEDIDDGESLTFGDDLKLDLGIEDLSKDLKSGNDILLKDIEVL